MAIFKRDIKNNELFIKPIRGLYEDQVITVDEFKEHHEQISKNRWVDTTHGKNGLKIYGLYDSSCENDVVKENLQEWLCDNRYEITNCISIALRNHECTYAEWFKYVDDKSGPDELALYCLSRKHGLHTSIVNKSYIWTTLSDHLTRTDEEILNLCGVNLVYLGPTTYSILCDICRPSSEASGSTLTAAMTRSAHTVPQRQCKTTCQSSSRGHESTSKKDRAHGHKNKGGKQGKRPQTLSESRSQNYGIQTSTSTATTRMLRSSCQPINYHSLNDGPDYVTPPSPKRCRKRTNRPRNAPSATRVAAQCSYSSPEAQEAVTQKLSGIPKDSTGNRETVTGFSGVLTTTASVHVDADKLPDLVTDKADPTQSTEEELEAADILLSLGDPRDDTLDGDENAQLMPIGGPSNVVDANPVPIK